MTTEITPTLCFPDTKKSCFACCPPIRPAGYEHLQYQNIIKRILRENTQTYAMRRESIVPITGHSCWALGYLDQRYKQVGCLLHPAQNGGVDLRYRVDYGEKCKRETCPAAKVFLKLSIAERNHWIHLADGLDSFFYSSAKHNPLFRMMGWGDEILRLIALNENGKALDKASFFRAYPFFSTGLNPKAHVYLLKKLFQLKNVDPLKSDSFRKYFEKFSAHLSNRLRKTVKQAPNTPLTHFLGLDPYYLDFLRLSVGLSRISLEEALRMKTAVDKAVHDF